MCRCPWQSGNSLSVEPVELADSGKPLTSKPQDPPVCFPYTGTASVYTMLSSFLLISRQYSLILLLSNTPLYVMFY